MAGEPGRVLTYGRRFSKQTLKSSRTFFIFILAASITQANTLYYLGVINPR